MTSEALTDIDGVTLYDMLAQDGYDYGPDFRRVTCLRYAGREGRAALNPTAAPGATALDAAFHALHPMISAALPEETLAGDLLLPQRIGRLRRGTGGPAATADLSLRCVSAESVTADITLRDAAGRAVLAVTAVRLDRLRRRSLQPCKLWVGDAVPLTPATPQETAQLADRLRLRFDGSDAGEVTDADLLLDALARRVAWETLGPPRAGEPPVAEGLRRALAVDGAAPGVSPCPYPPRDELVAAVLAHAPREAARLRAVLALDAATDAPEALPSEAKLSIPGSAALAATLGTAVESLASVWPAGRRLRVRTIGAEARLAAARLPASTLRFCNAMEAGDAAAQEIDLVIASEPTSAVAGRFTLAPAPAPAAERRAGALAALGLLVGPPRTGPAPYPAGRLGIAAWPVADTGLQVELSLGAQAPSPKRASQVLSQASGRIFGKAADPLLAAGLAAVLSDDASGDLVVLAGSPGEAPLTTWLEQTVAQLRAALAETPARLWLVGSAAADALSALIRTITNEHAAIESRLVTVDPSVDASATAARLSAFLANPPAERELHLTAEGDWAPRLRHHVPAHAATPPTGPAKLLLGRRGDLGSASWRPMSRRAPGPGEVELQIHAAALNFRDAMIASGALPIGMLEGGGAGGELGMDCAGVVLRSGPGVSIAPGTRVATVARAALATHAYARADALMPLPQDVDFPEAAALPVAMLTAEHALSEVARLGPDETLLIHAGAGGVGLAALDLARRRGARVFATAGTADKRALLRSLGAVEVFDSRSLEFADAVMDATDGVGVDLVLNGLSGPAMRRSLDCLAEGGRFIELGKRDAVENTQIGLGALAGNRSYHAIDIDSLLARRAPLARRLCATVAARIADGTRPHLPIQLFTSEQVADALRLIRRGGHIGKVVVLPPPAAEATPEIGGAWLISGGHGGIGLHLARWLAARGASKLWLVSRRGHPGPEERALFDEVASSGVETVSLAADIADPGAVADLLARIAAAGGLTGVIHAAGVARDATLAESAPALVSEVARPKLAGAELLDLATRALAPRHFVLIGSLASVTGNPGQAAYAAANGALAEVIARRRRQGLPGFVAALGPIADAGMLARNTRLRRRIADAAPGTLISAEQAVQGLEAALALPNPPAVLTIATEAWTDAVAPLPIVASPAFEEVRSQGPAALSVATRWRDAIAGRSSEAAAAYLTERLVETAAEVLRQPREEIDRHRPLAELGLDSLMAMDLKLRAEERFGGPMAGFGVADATSLADLGRALASESTTEDGDREILALAHRHGAPVDAISQAAAAAAAGAARP